LAISGRVPLLLLLGAVPAALWPLPAVVAGWALLVAAVCVVDGLLAARPDALAISRELPPSVRLSQQVRSRLTLANGGRKTARIQVRDGWPPSAQAAADRPKIRLPQGESIRVATLLTPTRRGRLQAGKVTIRSYGPLGLAARQRSFAVPGVLKVLPEFRSRAHLPYRLARLRELDGLAAVHVRGQGTEFDSLREYALGDDVRSIDWRASARAQKTMVRTWRPERDRHILIVLDTSRWAAGRMGGQTRLDSEIEACLLLGALGSAAGDRVSLLAFDRQLRARVASTSARAPVLAAFSDALSEVSPQLIEADWQLAAAQVGEMCNQRSLVVLLTGLDPALYGEGLGVVLPVLAHRHQLVVAHVDDPELARMRSDVSTAGAAYDAAAAGRLDLATGALASRVADLGVEVVRAAPERLAPAVCDAYLMLKAAGRL
jgi:uncharacterized protein (DUF58 family)